VPVNANLKPGDPALTRDHIWEGLLMKAYDAKPFVHLMTKCEVGQGATFIKNKLISSVN